MFKNQGSVVALFLAISALLIGGTAAQAAVIYVDAERGGPGADGSYDYPYATIQEGIDNADEYDTVDVAYGVYYETAETRNNYTALLHLKSKVTVKAACGATLMVEDTSGLTAVVSGRHIGYPNGEYTPIEGVVLRDLQIAIADYAPIYYSTFDIVSLVNFSNGNPTLEVNRIQNVRIVHENPSNTYGEAISTYFAPTEVIDCTIENFTIGIIANGTPGSTPSYLVSGNTITNVLRGVHASGYKSLITVEDNRVSEVQPGGSCIYLYWTKVDVRDNICTGGDFGVHAYNRIFGGSTIGGNTLNDAAAVGIGGWPCAMPDVFDNTFNNCTTDHTCF